MSIPNAFLAPVLRGRPGAAGNTAASSKLPPLGRNGAPASARGLSSVPSRNEISSSEKPGRKMLSARGVPGEAGARVAKVPTGFAPPPALPNGRDLVNPPVPDAYSATGLAGDRFVRSDRGAPTKQARALPSKLAPLPTSENSVPAASTVEAQSNPGSEQPASQAPLLPEVELLDSQFNAVSSQLREQTAQLLESQHALQRKAESLEQMLNDTCIAKEAEVAHSRKLAEAFSRESARCEEVRQEVEAARFEKQILQSELDDLQIKRFRATELSSNSGIDQELLMILKAENEALLAELRRSYARPDIEEEISSVSRELAKNKPMMQQLRKGLTDVYVHNTELKQQNDKLYDEISSLRDELGIPESAPDLLELSDSEDNDLDEEQCVSMLIDPKEEDMQVSVRIHVPRSMVNQLAATM